MPFPHRKCGFSSTHVTHVCLDLFGLKTVPLQLQSGKHPHFAARRPESQTQSVGSKPTGPPGPMGLMPAPAPRVGFEDEAVYLVQGTWA